MIIILITGDRMALIAIFYYILYLFFKNSRKHGYDFRNIFIFCRTYDD